jgi:hypothetical protein
MTDDAKALARHSFSRRVFIRTSTILGGAIVAPWLGRTHASVAQATTDPSLKAAFNNAVNAFNSQDSNKLSPLLDEHVVLKKIHASHVPPDFNGREKVMAYLEGAWHGSSSPPWIFNPNYDDGPKFTQNDPNNATVTGEAWWHDNDGQDPDGPLNYEFKFKKNGSIWQVKSLWGCYPGKACAPKP